MGAGPGGRAPRSIGADHLVHPRHKAGPDELIKATVQFEVFDEARKKETAVHSGIATLPPMHFDGRTPESAAVAIESAAAALIASGKKPVFVGGEHSITIGVVRAMAKTYPDLTVLHRGAHADLRPSYEGSPYNHACVMARVAEVARFVSVGVRSMETAEYRRIKKENLHVSDIHFMRMQQDWQTRVLDKLSGPVYITLDLSTHWIPLKCPQWARLSQGECPGIKPRLFFAVFLPNIKW